MPSPEVTCASSVFEYLRDRPGDVLATDVMDAIDGWTPNMVAIAIARMLEDGLIIAGGGRKKRRVLSLGPIAMRPIPGQVPRARKPRLKKLTPAQERKERERAHRRRLTLIASLAQKRGD